jgi:hypothetical protein
MSQIHSERQAMLTDRPKEKLIDLPIYFVDIEAVRTVEKFADNNPLCQLFEKKFRPKKETSEAFDPYKLWEDQAAFHAEFCKIICISMGVLVNGKFYIKTVFGDDERKLLIEAEDAIAPAQTLCGHNALEYDYPVWMRRSIVNGVPIPAILNTSGKKIWDVKDKLLDTVQIWSGTQYNHRISLQLAAHLLGLPDPKQTMDGSMVGKLYYSQEPDKLKKIGKYCAGDVFTEANVYLRMKGEELITEDQIVYK